MEKQRVPCVFYPSTCIIVDDQTTFLDNIILKIEPHTFCKTYSDPNEALHFIRQGKKNDFLLAAILTDIESSSYLPASSDIPVRIDISNLYKSIYDADHFSEISVAIVDFAMPIMEGSVFCKHLIDSPIKKIMLTGEADEAVAVQLFNEGVIDKFIRKGSPNVYELLNQSIIEMQRKYFQEISDPIVNKLPPDQYCCLDDVAFIQLFEKVRIENSATSFYLIDPTGSFIFFDDKASPTWLIIKTPSDIKDVIDILTDMGASKKILQALQEGSLVPYFRNVEHLMDVAESKKNIDHYFYPAQKLEGKHHYTYAITKTLQDFPLGNNSIVSFNDYLNTN